LLLGMLPGSKMCEMVAYSQFNRAQ
jgi:hypothetical protein